MTPNDCAMKFKENLHTNDYEYWYEKVLLAYKGLLGKHSFFNGIPNEDLFNEFVCRLPQLAEKWNPARGAFSNFLTHSLRGNIKQQFLADTLYPVKYSRAPLMRNRYKVHRESIEEAAPLRTQTLNALEQLLYNELEELIGDFESAYKSRNGMGKFAKEEYRQIKELVYGKD